MSEPIEKITYLHPPRQKFRESQQCSAETACKPNVSFVCMCVCVCVLSFSHSNFWLVTQVSSHVVLTYSSHPLILDHSLSRVDIVPVLSVWWCGAERNFFPESTSLFSLRRDFEFFWEKICVLIGLPVSLPQIYVPCLVSSSHFLAASEDTEFLAVRLRTISNERESHNNDENDDDDGKYKIGRKDKRDTCVVDTIGTRNRKWR